MSRPLFCRQLFEVHVMSSQPMKMKNLQQMIRTVNCASENMFRLVPSSYNLHERITMYMYVNSDIFIYSTLLRFPPEFVCVMWTDELTGAVEQGNFLLDKGRLKLKTIKQAFNASLVQISIGK